MIEAEASERAISKMHPNVLDQTSLTRDAVQVSDQENAEQHFGVDRWLTRVAAVCLQCFANKREVDVAINKPQQMIFGNMIFQSGSRKRATQNEFVGPS